MERQPIFRDRYEVTEDDLENLTAWTQQSDDHIVGDAIEAGRKFTGFAVDGTSTTSVSVASGRLYYNGMRHYDETPGGYPLDLSGVGLRPDLQKRIVSIVVSPTTIEDDVEERDYETDAESGTKEPRQVKVERRRAVRIEAVGGVESVDPRPLVIASTAVVVAYVLMGTGGIEKITRNTAAVLDNAADTATAARALETWRGTAEPIISGLQSALAALAAASSGQADRKLIYDLASDVAVIKQRQGLPATYTGYDADPFTDTSRSNTAALGYAARTEEGLRLPYAAIAEGQLALNNIYDPNVVLTGDGLLLPKYTRVEDRVVRGEIALISLATYSNEIRTFTKLTLAGNRIRFGADYEISTGSADYLSGTFAARVNGAVRNTFFKDGQTFQVYDTGKVDQDGHRMVRLSKYWTDTTAVPYWSRTSTPDTVTGYAHCETFLNKNDRWIVAMAPHIRSKPSSGTLAFGLCGTYRGQPDFDQVLTMTMQDASAVKLAGPEGPDSYSTPIEPVFLKGGEFYTYFVVTSANFEHGVADEQNPHSGTYFYGLNGGTWFPVPNVHLIFALFSAYFGTTYVETELTPLSLPGGIQGVDILADGHTPDNCDVVYSLYVNNQWRTLDELDPTVLNSLPPLARLKIGFSGTPDCMPGVKLSGSRARATRLALAGRHISTAKGLPAPSTRIIERLRLLTFDAAHNTLTMKVNPGTGLVSPDTVVDEKQIDGTVQRTLTFNLGSATSSYTSQIDYATDSVFRAVVVSPKTEIATA